MWVGERKAITSEGLKIEKEYLERRLEELGGGPIRMRAAVGRDAS